MLGKVYACRVLWFYLLQSQYFMYFIIDAQEANLIIVYNHGLETRSCFTSITDVSYTQCLGYFRNNTTYINAVVYRRRFHLCDMYSVAGKFAYKQEPGSMLAHRPVVGK
jgi:hypothetical protein